MQYYIYLKTQPYLAEFVKHSFGNPVQLDRDSPESRIIREYITKLPANNQPDMGEDANLAVQLPFFKEADPRVYNHLGVAAKSALVESFNQLFEKCMLKEIGSIENVHRGKISDLIYAWMEKHGIPDNDVNWETIRQKYYRLRKKYRKNNVNL
ncbi:hypothetical protein SAMD00024442_6_19 [Candidatus Symbiothrix dinenymphae]|nr:hypothetical protein SAMD00024442_6_19 [Candidatus Symbiothrix dinenymphae]